MNEVLLKDLLLETKDGEWGASSPGEGFTEMRVIRGTDFAKARFGDLTSTPTRYISNSAATRKALQPNDILIETAGGTVDMPTGRTVFLKNSLFREGEPPITCASFSRFLRVNPMLAHPGYIFWFLQYLYQSGQMQEHQVQHTGVARFQYTKFAHSTVVPLPDEGIQSRISSMLFSLDDKIELNRRMNETLEAMVRAIFRSWFVDFDPVRIKARGGDPTVELGLSPEIAALFPDSFQDSELGEVPAGWDCIEVGSLARIERGLSYKGSGLTDDGLPMINLGCFKGNGVFSSGALKNYSGEFKDRNLVSQGDLVYANTDITQDRIVIGSPALVPDVDGQPLLFSHHVSCLRFFDNLAPLKTYVYYTMLQASFRERASGFATGTTVLALPKDAVEKLLLVLPSSELLKHLEEVVSSMRGMQTANDRESTQLSEVRDYLLPRLLSGSIQANGEDEP